MPGLLKKISQLSVLCGVKFTVFVSDIRGSIHYFSNNFKKHKPYLPHFRIEEFLEKGTKVYQYVEEDGIFKKTQIKKKLEFVNNKILAFLGKRPQPENQEDQPTCPDSLWSQQPFQHNGNKLLKLPTMMTTPDLNINTAETSNENTDSIQDITLRMKRCVFSIYNFPMKFLDKVIKERDFQFDRTFSKKLHKKYQEFILKINEMIDKCAHSHIITLLCYKIILNLLIHRQNISLALCFGELSEKQITFLLNLVIQKPKDGYSEYLDFDNESLNKCSSVFSFNSFSILQSKKSKSRNFSQNNKEEPKMMNTIDEKCDAIGKALSVIFGQICSKIPASADFSFKKLIERPDADTKKFEAIKLFILQKNTILRLNASETFNFYSFFKFDNKSLGSHSIDKLITRRVSEIMQTIPKKESLVLMENGIYFLMIGFGIQSLHLHLYRKIIQQKKSRQGNK